MVRKLKPKYNFFGNLLSTGGVSTLTELCENMRKTRYLSITGLHYFIQFP